MRVRLSEEILYNGILYVPDDEGMCEIPEEVAIALSLISPGATVDTQSAGNPIIPEGEEEIPPPSNAGTKAVKK